MHILIYIHLADEDNTEQTYEIYSTDVVSTPGFQSYHDRLQTFLLWYIEAASFIDIDDDKWKFFLM
jgi:histone acetyltransferase 1